MTLTTLASVWGSELVFDWRYSESFNSVVTLGKMSNNMTNWCLDFGFQVMAKL
jgi:hypothetical protein